MYNVDGDQEKMLLLLWNGTKLCELHFISDKFMLTKIFNILYLCDKSGTIQANFHDEGYAGCLNRRNSSSSIYGTYYVKN